MTHPPWQAGPMTDWLAQAWRHELKQPDQRSCGAAVLVVARMINDAGYAEALVAGRHPATGWTPEGETLLDRFAAETLAMHKRSTGLVDVRGRLQVPWPETFGTPPWAVARQMSGASGVPGTTYDARPVSPFDRRDSLAAILHATRNGHVVPVFVGNRWSPRHVVLVLDPDLVTYDPARGRRVDLRANDFVEGELMNASWPVPWFAVLPE